MRATAERDFDTRNKETVAILTEFFKGAPQALAAPGVAAAYLRMVGDGNPKVEQMADLLEPGGKGEEMTTQQLQAELMKAGQQNQQLTQLVQQMQQALAAKLPEIEAKKWQAALDAVTKIRVAEISASKDLDRAGGDREAAHFETVLGMAHDTAMQATEHEHAAGMQADQQEAGLEQQKQAAELQPAGEA